MGLQVKLFGKILHSVSSAAGTRHTSMLETPRRSQRCFEYSPGEPLSYATWSLKNRDASKPHG